MELNQSQRANTSPKEAADEIRAQLEEYRGLNIPDFLRWAPKPGREAEELDPLRVATRAAERIGICGTFPRGKMVLIYRGGERQELGAHQCNHRACPRCGKRRGRRLGEDMAAAVGRISDWGFKSDRIRFATLTIPNMENAAEGMHLLSEAWHRVLANRRFSALVAGGFRCFEVKAGKDGKWNVHLHAILYTWAQGIPYQVIREVWDKAAGAPEGTTYNQRFDILKNHAKTKEGETKAHAAARYLVKYIAKWEDLKDSRNAPGGLPHLLAAMEGRRMFSAWGIGAASRKLCRMENPEWAETVNRCIAGYQRGGETPIAAMVDSPWLGLHGVPVPRPSMPACLSLDQLAEQAEPSKDKVMNIYTGNPLGKYAKQLENFPKTKQTLKDWLGHQEYARKARERLRESVKGERAYRAALRLWKEANPKPEMPQPFRWRAFVTDAPKEWTARAETILGTREPGKSLGSLLWSKVECTEPGVNIPLDDRRSWRSQMENAYKDAIRTAQGHLRKCFTLEQRAEYLQSLPANVGKYWEETADGYC